jgi:ATP synthase protein I
MSESGPPEPLRRLGEQIDQARSRTEQEGGRGRGDVTSGGNALGFGLRVGIELVAALGVGIALGWLADRYLGIRPWGLIVGFFLGSAAGIVNVYRAVQGMGGGPPGGRGG